MAPALNAPAQRAGWRLRPARSARPARPSRTAPWGRCARHAQRGQSAIEYTVACAALAFALGVGMVDDQSVLRMLLEAFRTAYEKFSYALSLPL